LLQGSAARDKDLLTIFKAQLLFWMLAATDGHGKNFSIRLLPRGRYKLTPLYDVLSAWPIVGKKTNQIAREKIRLAMSIHSKHPRYRINDIQPRHFQALARQLGLPDDGPAILHEVAARTRHVLDEVDRKLPDAFPRIVRDAIFDSLLKSARHIEQFA
jgi:serine/threonine-protein kinase HipA